MMRAAPGRWLAPALVSIALLGGASLAGAAGEMKPGAYCPLPEPGQEPACLDPARAEFAQFFSELERGDLDDAEAAGLEREVGAGAAGRNPYLALSSLSYGYFRLSQEAARAEPDPLVVARLERWNALLSKAFLASEEDESYRAAVREAAVDIRDKAPEVTLRCVDERGDEVECDSTEAVIRGIDATSREVGIEGALSRLIERLFGDGDDS